MAEWTSRAATGFGSEAAYGADPAPRALKTRSTHVCDTLARAGSPRKPENRGSAFGLGNELGRRDDAKGREKLSLDRNGIKLAEFLCRSQTRSPKFPGLNGTWFRAFDDQRWEAWASSADVGWGAWSLEAGWGQAWTAAVLGLRELHTTVWDFTARSRAGEHFAALKTQMLPGG